MRFQLTLESQQIIIRQAPLMNSSHLWKLHPTVPPLLDIPFFDDLRKLTSTLNMEKLKANLKLSQYNPGDILLDSHSERQFVFVVRGRLALYLNHPNTNEEDQVRIYSENEFLGETETVNHKYLVKLVAETPSVVYRLCKTGMYQHLRAVFPFPELIAKINFIKSLHYFANFHEASFERMIERSRDIKPSMGSTIYSQGEMVNSVYVIIQGDFELSKKVKKSRAIYTIDVSTVSVGECLGIQEVIMNQLSQETVKCVSSNALIVQLDKQLIKNCMTGWNREMIKSRSNWRKHRVEKSGEMIEMYMRSALSEVSDGENVSSASQEPHHQSYDDYLKQKSLESKTKYITNKKPGTLKRPQTTSLTTKTVDTHFNLLPSHRKRPTTTNQKHHNKSQQSLERRIPNSQIFFEQFLQKKQRLHNNMLMRYLKTRPPELVFNPEKEYAVMKSLNVKPSNAVNNKKKTLAILKHRYFNSGTIEAEIMRGFERLKEGKQ